MTDEDKKETAKSAESGTPRAHLSGHFELDLPKTEKEASESAKKEKTFRSRLANDLRKPRFYLEFAALIIVGIYTYQAWKANCLTRQVLEVSERPVISVASYNYGYGAVLSNSGKLTAIATVRKKAAFSSERLRSGPDLPQIKERLILPTAQNSNTIVFPYSGVGRAGGWYYLSGLITYGNGYFTRFCREYAVMPDGGVTDKGLCQDPSTNDSN